LIPNSLSEARNSRSRKPVKKFLSKRAYRIIVCGYDQKESYQKYFNAPPEKVVVIPNSRPVREIQSRISSLRSDVPTLKQQLGLPDVPIVCCIARLEPQKDQATLIHGFEKYLKSCNSNSHLVLVGCGPDEPYLRSLVNGSLDSKVTFAGHQEDIFPWLAVSDTFVLASRSEGLPGSLVEAMAARVPCVATSIPGNTELIEHGKTGLTFPVSDPTTLGAMLKETMINGSLGQSRIEAAFSKVLNKYNSENETKLWEGFLAEFLDFAQSHSSN
jgi:glycosyltransferase involved in cell wall biosynthesis